jgi:hypothetical protein
MKTKYMIPKICVITMDRDLCDGDPAFPTTVSPGLDGENRAKRWQRTIPEELPGTEEVQSPKLKSVWDD